MKKMQIFSLSLWLAALFLVSCCKEETEPEVISNGAISLQLWNGWRYRSLPAIDLFQGIFWDCHETIHFAEEFIGGFQAWDSIQATPETLYFEELIIDGMPAKILKRKEGKLNHIVMHLDDPINGTRIRLSVTNPDNDEAYINVFKSLHIL